MVIYREKIVRIFNYKHLILTKFESLEIFKLYEENTDYNWLAVER